WFRLLDCLDSLLPPSAAHPSPASIAPVEAAAADLPQQMSRNFRDEAGGGAGIGSAIAREADLRREHHEIVLGTGDGDVEQPAFLRIAADGILRQRAAG